MVQWKLNFSTLCLHVKESHKACEESRKAPCKNTSKPPFSGEGFWIKIFFFFLLF